MALAETAELAVNLALHGGSQYKAGITEAEAATANLNRTVKSSTNILGGTASNFSLLKQAAVSTGAAISGMATHFKNVITGPLGLIGIGAGLLSITGVIEGSVKKLEDFAGALEKVQTLTGETVQQSSALILLYEKYGLGVDKVTQTVGFAEKTLGKLNNTMAGKTAPGLTKLQVLDKQYGLQLLDSKNKVVDYSTVLAQLADVYDRNIPASTKAYIASQVLGRGYTALIPILKGGSAALREASAAAAALNVDPSKLAAFRDQMRNLGEQVNVLQLRIGMALVPTISKFVGQISGWLAGGGSDRLVKFFSDAGDAASSFADVLTGSVFPTIHAMASAALAAWNTIPAPLRDILVKGFVADRTIHFLFGVSPLNLAKNLIGDIIGPILGRVGGGFLQRGGSPANPLWVAEAGGGLGGGAAGGGLISSALKLAVPILGGLAIAAAWKTIVQDPQLQAQANKNLSLGVSATTSGKSLPDLQTALAGAKEGLRQLTNGGLFQPVIDQLYGEEIDKTRRLVVMLQDAVDKEKAKAQASTLTHFDPTNRKTAFSAMERNRGTIGTELAQAEQHRAAVVAAGILKSAAARDRDASGALKDAAARLKAAALALHPAPTVQRANAILATGAAHDKETSDAINQINKLADSSDIERLQSKVAAGLTRDTSQVRASGAGIIGAIRASRPIVNVTASISATGVTHTSTVVSRAGATGGTRLTAADYTHGK